MTVLLNWLNVSTGWLGTALPLPECWRSGTLRAGDRVLLVGPNGCGKSTLLYALAGVLPVLSGTVAIRGKIAMHLSTQQRLCLGLSLVPQNAPFFDGLTVGGNADLILGRAGKPRNGPFDSWVRDRHRVRLRSASGGERQKVALERAWRSGAQILLLDEPWNGLDEESSSALDAALMQFSGAIVAIRHLHDSDDAARHGWTLLPFQ